MILVLMPLIRSLQEGVMTLLEEKEATILFMVRLAMTILRAMTVMIRFMEVRAQTRSMVERVMIHLMGV